MMNRPPFLPRSSSFQFLLFKLLTLIQLFDHSSGCTPAGSGCCSSPRPASCGNLPPCSPGSMSASHLSSYSHVAPPPPLHEKGGYGHGHDGGEYGYHSDGVGYEHGGYEQERGYGEGGYGSGSGYGQKPPPYQPPPGSYGQISYGQLPPTGSYGGMGYSQPGGYSSNYPSYQPPPPMPAAPLMPPNYYPSSPPPSAIPSPQYLPPPPPPPYGTQPYPQSISLPVQQPVYSIGNSPLPPYPAQYPELASSYHSSSLSSYNPQQQQYPQLTPSQYSPAISSPSFAEPIYSNGYSNGGAMPPGIMPPSYQNPQSNGGGMISYPPNGPFLMTLAGGPPGGYKTNKKQKILLVEKLMAKDKAASVKEKVAAAVKEKMTKE